jgi:Smr domain
MATSLPSSLPSHSHSWNQNRRSEQQIQPFATLDLHGHTKESAIRTLTTFCEQSALSASRNNPWINVITGTGCHSGALGGPILKQTIQKLLIKRQMEYCYSKKKGFFLVNVLSGLVLKQNPTRDELQVAAAGDSAILVDDERFGEQDTKLKFVARNDLPPVAPSILRPNHKKKVVGKKMRKDLQTYSLVAATYTTAAQRLGSSHHDPLPSELSADEERIQQAKTQSLHEIRKLQSQRDKEQYTVEQILQKTQQEELEKDQREQEELQRAMALSQQKAQQEELEKDQQEQEELQRAMSLSQQQTPTTSTEDEELERILQLSLQEAEQQKPSHSVSTFATDDENDEELQRILSQSNLEHLRNQQEEAELERFLRQSLMTDIRNNPQQVSSTCVPNY